MDMHDLLNEASDEEWEFESDVDDEEEEDTNESADCEEGTDTETDTASEAAAARPAAQRKLTGNSYVDEIIGESGLHIVRPAEVDRAYKERGELGLFSLFFTREFRDSLQSWSNLLLKEKGKPEATVFEIDAYIGLEIVMSIIPLTEIIEFWSHKLFLGHPDFPKTMPKNRFEIIRP
ncbi:Hypothetical protein PHPALM_5770, partial [Phytophthora palmivora]